MIVKHIQEKIKTEAFDALLLTGLENPAAKKNLQYVTNYTGSYGFAIIGEDYKYFISDFRYRDQVAEEVPDFTFVEITGAFLDALKEVIQKESITSLGFDKRIRYSEYELYQTLGVTLHPLNNFMESFRVSKTPEEVAKIKKACEITDQALADILQELKVGMIEKDVEIKLKNRMIELGAEVTWDRFIVASGARGAMPHGMASDKRIEKGDLVTFDIGCAYEGYYSDLTRTVAMGKPSSKMKELYEIVKEAQRRGVAAAKAGMTGKELDAVCRDYITERGYGEYFKHGTGHGLGMDVHEAPRVSYAYDKPLEVGACVTIEPGIYISGLGGVRIEDDVILTEDGCIVLNEFPKELLIIE
ncbi:M24 family metallopeptidase [Candidatus Xianfuyuplasma coldseepsis]|uniref:Aminopeptidase P family protein n=1 Tax=Candidatus Xianfuyuplasma coldseepsis TaxID=2782163 RepID=A0A7L7KTV9_9MOLU|nr:aminopeptidase P family protein [Xianfuyuplasma coldseepsis]QMS85218.1 aminopeptidase P family protein [Xianfuyuplasma coldseepsis]